MKNKKILVIASGDSKYGAAKSLKQLIIELMEIGNDITVLLHRYSELEEEYRKSGCEVHKLNYQCFCNVKPQNIIKYIMVYFVRLFQYITGKYDALRYIEKNIVMDDIDLVYTNTSRIDMGAIIAKRYSKPHVWHLREFNNDKQLFYFCRDYINYMNKNTTFFICNSKATSNHWIKKGLSPSKVNMVYNGIKINENYKQNYNDHEKLKLIMIGSFSNNKGQHLLIKAISLLPSKIKEQITLELYGSGKKEYINYLHSIIDKNNLQQIVNICDYDENICKRLMNYDIGFMCSENEAFGRVTIEYGMAGLGIIASDNGASRELIIDHVRGLLFKVGDVDDLKNKIIEFVENRELLKSCGISAREHYIKHFSSKRNAEEINKIFTKAINNLD